MRVLIDLKTWKEVDQDVFEPQPTVPFYKFQSPIAQGVIHMYVTLSWLSLLADLTRTSHLGQLIRLPDYFEEKGWHCPTDAYDSPFQFAVGTKLHQFDWIAQHPKLQHAFNVTMTMRTKNFDDSKWFDVFPVAQLMDQKTPAEVFMVDIGGGVGHNMIELKEHYPDIPGKLVVQDIAPVIESVTGMPDGIEAEVQDFFKPQPVRFARAYFLAHVLHDWPDKQAKVILDQVRDAMAPDSVVLLNEAIMPERGVGFLPAAMDLTMMAAYSSLERTEAQFRDLLDSAGLALTQIWSMKEGYSKGKMLAQFVIEARLKS